MSLLLIDQPYRVDSLCQGIDRLQCHSQGLPYTTWVTPCPRWYTNARTLAHRAATQNLRVFFFVKKISPGRRADNHINNQEISGHSAGRCELLSLLNALEDVIQTIHIVPGIR